MTDRLEWIEQHWEGDQADGLGLLHIDDFEWLIAEVKQLRDENKHLKRGRSQDIQELTETGEMLEQAQIEIKRLVLLHDATYRALRDARTEALRKAQQLDL